MYISLTLIIILSISLYLIFEKLKFPGLLAFILTGIILGPFVLDLIDARILNLSAELRKIALVVILIRAGLSLNISDLKEMGTPAILLSFLPALFEILIIGLISPLLFDLTYLEGFILGSVIAAVSPAVIVPKMIKYIDKHKKNDTLVARIVLGSASVDDVIVIVIFTTLIQFYQNQNEIIKDMFFIPISIISGIILGIISGLFLVYIFKKIHLRDTYKVMVIFAIAFFFIFLEDLIPISGLLSIMSLGIIIMSFYPVLANRLAPKLSKIWAISEIILFVLIGAAVDIFLFQTIGLWTILLLVISLSARTIGVLISISKSRFKFKEKMFISVSFIPKATVQAAIGAIPLTLGMPGGEIILAISVVSILTTAPIGAFLIDHVGKTLFNHTINVQS